MTGANHGTRWTKDEIAFLESEWDGTLATAEVIGEILGRTADACMQRHYELTWGTRSADGARTEITFEVDPRAGVHPVLDRSVRLGQQLLLLRK